MIIFSIRFSLMNDLYQERNASLIASLNSMIWHCYAYAMNYSVESMY
ncbi:hypothetical protein [Microbacter margulisiae]|uniref:Uncharacterized protein n=1 Tax=Microbacter margulisiae TaxID=1350067 RepID=A0A7W5H1V8_9PORP|nr:hypothetical protein [Microbacter margulisiae]MBB3186801.1 hypothetical protein [Microbacter margulisiae]